MRRLAALALVSLVCAQAGACGGGDSAPQPTAESPADAAAPPVLEDAGTPIVDSGQVDTGNDAGPPPCKPSGGGPYWVEEGQPVTAKIVCKGVDYPVTIAPLPAGATFDAATKTLTWTPGLDQAAVYLPKITVPKTGETAIFKIGVADKFDDPANVAIVDPLTYTEEFGLPVFHLTTDPAITDLDQKPATIKYRGHVYNGEAKYRGAASLGYPKKSFTLKFDKLDKFNEPNVPPKGFMKKRQVVLITAFDDNSYVRQRLSYEAWNRIDPSHIIVQNYSAVVILNGQYWGMYTATDHIDGYLMEDFGLLQQGNLYKAIDHDANFKLTRNSPVVPKAALSMGYEKQEGTPLHGQPGAYDDLISLVDFVATSDTATFAGGIGSRIAVKEYQDWLIVTTAIVARDSLGKNSYQYHNPAGGLWRAVPWDFNHAFGQTWQTRRELPNLDPDAITSINYLFTRFLNDPAFGPALKARYDAVLKKELSLATMLAMFDAMVAEVDACARRDERKWRSRYLTYGGWASRTDFTDFDGEVAYVRQWIKDRWAWLDNKY